MGLQIADIIPKKEIQFSDLKGKTIAVDAFNSLYQFLTTIRQPDGTPLKDSNNNVTSHLSGLFYRNMSLILEDIKLIYVFDGQPPDLKEKIRELRREQRQKAEEKYQIAVDEEQVDDMGKYAKPDIFLDEKKIQESKQLLEAMGIAVIQAPGEGEAQASNLTKNKQAYAVSSQDYDCLMFQAPLMIQNLSLARRRKTISGYRDNTPQLIDLKQTLNHLEINQEQLICLGILSGTDYNPGGVKGLGPKKSLKLVKEYKTKEKIFQALEQDEKLKEKYQVDFDWQKIYDEINQPNIQPNLEINFPKLNKDKIKEILISREFSEKRIDSQLDKLEKLEKNKEQRTLF
jgi:flap endonuclease-1|tara:strand:- start:59 stop:1090 length:1032 start_codon:yes stop_codon:yes gene_type:complete